MAAITPTSPAHQSSSAWQLGRLAIEGTEWVVNKIRRRKNIEVPDCVDLTDLLEVDESTLGGQLISVQATSSDAQAPQGEPKQFSWKNTSNGHENLHVYSW